MKGHYAPLGPAGCSSALTGPLLLKKPSVIPSQRKALPVQLRQKGSLVKAVSLLQAKG